MTESLRCWENGPLTEDGCSTTCVLQADHDGEHEWTRDDEIRLSFEERKCEPSTMSS
jgi:hypothetical protein